MMFGIKIEDMSTDISSKFINAFIKKVTVNTISR